jgi:sugar lactone lactonase YvrE
MKQTNGRYTAAQVIRPAEGWSVERLTPVSRLFNANGMRTWTDGRIYVVQGIGSQVSAIDPDTAEIEVIEPKGGGIVGPDDLAFDVRGNLYVTEVMDGRVSVREPNGRTRVLRDDLPNANGITFFQDRLFVDECREGGRLLELDLNGGPPKVLLEDLPLPNALAPGPDGMLYFPMLGANEIWRIHPDGGQAERVVGDLGVPDAVKFDSKGNIVSTQVGSGEVLRIDPRSGTRTRLAALDPGLDNLTFVGERLFVSHLVDGRITEILADGATQPLISPQFNWPLDLTMADDGQLYICDGFTFWSLRPGEPRRAVSNVFDANSPHGMRGLAPLGGGAFAVATWDGKVCRYRPAEAAYEVLTEGLDELYGVAVTSGGAILTAEARAGRLVSVTAAGVEVVAQGLDRPMGVALGGGGEVYVGEAGAGRVVKIEGGRTETVVDGLGRPHGVLVQGGTLFVLDVAAQQLLAVDLATRARRIIAAELPVGAPPGVTPKPLIGVPWFCGPLGPFAGLTAGPDGTLYLSADAEGSVLAVRPERG